MVDFSAPYNALLQQNMAPPPNPLTQASQLVGLQNQELQNRTLNATADDAELANAQNHINFVTQAMTAPLVMGDKVRLGDVASAGADAVAGSKGRISSQEIGQFLSTLPPDPADPAAPNPALQTALRQHQTRLLGALQQIEVLRGQNSAVNSGNKTLVINSDGFTNQPRVAGSIQNTLDPAAAASLQAGPVDPVTGVKTMIPMGRAAEQYGLAAPGTYTGAGGGGADAIPISINRSGQITKRAMSEGGQTMQPSISPPGPAAGGAPAFGSNTSATMPSGGIQTEPSPGQAVALKSSGDQYAAAGQNQATYAQQMQQLQSGLTSLQNTNTGPGTEARQAIASYMLALPGGIGQYLPGVDPKSIAAFDEANKYLTQAAVGSPSATRSDAGQNAAIQSNPSVHISNSAAQDVLKANIGFRRTEMANYAAFAKTGQDPGQFTSWLAQRNQQIDPRAYSVDLLSQPQRQGFMSSLSGQAKAKFLGSVRDAIANRIIDPRALQGGVGGGQ